MPSKTSLMLRGCEKFLVAPSLVTPARAGVHLAAAQPRQIPKRVATVRKLRNGGGLGPGLRRDDGNLADRKIWLACSLMWSPRNVCGCVISPGQPGREGRAYP